MRGYHVGGRSLMWGRQSYRFSDLDFEANARDGLPQLPDGQFLPAMEMNCLERQVKERIAKSFGGRAMIIASTFA